MKKYFYSFQSTFDSPFFVYQFHALKSIRLSFLASLSYFHLVRSYVKIFLNNFFKNNMDMYQCLLLFLAVANPSGWQLCDEREFCLCQAEFDVYECVDSPAVQEFCRKETHGDDEKEVINIFFYLL